MTTLRLVCRTRLTAASTLALRQKNGKLWVETDKRRRGLLHVRRLLLVNRLKAVQGTLRAMAAAVTHKATYEDLLRVPDPLTAEIIDGVLHASPRPAFPHVNASGAVFSRISWPFYYGAGRASQWIILSEPELHLGADIVVPDIAGWRRERMPKVPNVKYSALPPDWVCEALSPSTCNLDRTIKMAIYAREGVRHLWLIDPIARALEIYRLEEGVLNPVAAYCDNAVVRAEPFDAIEIDLAGLWIDADD